MGAFFSKTIRSSPRHRAVLINCLAVGAALMTLSIVANRRNLQALTSGNPFFLAQSLLLVFVLLAGIRVVVDVPAALEEQLGLPGDGIRRKEPLCVGPQKDDLPPMAPPSFAPDLLCPSLALGGLAGGPGPCGLLSGPLRARARSPLLSFPEDPVRQHPCAGPLRLQTRGVPYLAGLLGLLAALAGLEKALLSRPRSFWVFLPVSAVLWAFLRHHNARYLKDHALVYEEEPEPAMTGFPEDV